MFGAVLRLFKSRKFLTGVIATIGNVVVVRLMGDSTIAMVLIAGITAIAAFNIMAIAKEDAAEKANKK